MYNNTKNLSESKKLEHINKFLLNKSPKDIQKIVVKNFKKRNNDIDELSKIKNKSIEIENYLYGGQLNFTNELHYAVYNKGSIVTFNKFLQREIESHTNPVMFSKWVDSKNEALSKNISELKLSAEELNIIDESGKVSKDENYIKDKIKLVHGSDVTFTNGKVNLIEDGQLSEIAKKYLWTRNLIINEYANITTKGVYLHPSKNIILKTDPKTGLPTYSDELYDSEENERATTFTKRMVISGATMNVYGKSASGILPKIKVAVLGELSSPVYGPTEQNSPGKTKEKEQDVFDGGCFSNPFFWMFSKKSLPGSGYSRVQKPIGTSISDFSSSLLKFATFGLNNELIRNSVGNNIDLYNMMQKMNSIPFKNANVFETSEINYNDYILDAFSNLYVAFGNGYSKITNIEPLVEEDGSHFAEYLVTYDGDATKTKKFTVNSLFDL